MAIIETPKLKYSESDSNPKYTGDGAEIPIFIGLTGNGTPATGVQKFKDYDACAKSVDNGGIGTDITSNPLLATLKDFFNESKKINSDDVTVPYVYVIDLGKIGVSEAEDVEKWIGAMKLAKTKREVQAEVYVGFKKADTVAKIIPLLESANSYIVSDAEKGNPRIAYFTVDGMNDEELITIADSTQSKFIQKSRIVLCEPLLFGATLAKIFTTHYSEEPGYTDYRSIPSGTFIERTETVENNLMNAGVLFNRDEYVASEIHPKICLAVSTAFGITPADNRPNDALLHARRNVDQLIRDTFYTLYPQLKRNETEINLAYLQADLDTLVNEKIKAGYMLDGTVIDVEEDSVNPYDLKVSGVAVPVNATELIGFSMYIEKPNTTVRG